MLRKVTIKFLLKCDKILNILINKIDNMSTRDKLVSLFKLHSKIESEINNVCVELYHGKHPKHHLWTGHYRFVLDNVNDNDAVFDVGTGASCSYTHELAKKCKKIDCCDYKQELVDRSIVNNKYENINYFVMDITKDLPNGKYDVVIMSHVLEHLHEPQQVLNRVKEITSKIIVRLPRYDDHWMYLVKKDLGMFYFKDGDHKAEYTLETAIDLLKGAGWEIEQALNDIDIKIVATIKK